MTTSAAAASATNAKTATTDLPDRVADREEAALRGAAAAAGSGPLAQLSGAVAAVKRALDAFRRG